MEYDALNADPTSHQRAVRGIAAAIRAIAWRHNLSISQTASAFGISRALIYSWERKNWKRPLRANTRRSLLEAKISTEQLRAQVIAYDRAFCDPLLGLSRRSKVRSMAQLREALSL